jgi:dipeptidyl-peptidase-4
MKKNILNPVLIAIMIAFSSYSFAQKTQYSSIREAIVSAGQLNGQGAPSNLTWIENGDKYSFTRTNEGAQEIWTHNMNSGEEELVFTSRDLNIPGSGQAFSYREFQWTKDFKYLLFQTNFRPVWRYSGNSDYYYYSIDDKSLKPVVESAFTAEVSPDGTMLGYGKDGNLFVFEFGTGDHKQLTDDAEDAFYNGRFGWAYEEEFGMVQAWAWSPDSKYIAFWQSDEREVPIYKLTDFSGTHPEYMEIPYPKVGDPNPKVKIGIIDVKSNSKNWLDIPLNDGYIPRIYWTSDPDKLAVIYLNREHDLLKVYMCNTKTGNNQVILEESSDSWIDVFDFFGNRMHHFYFPQEMSSFFFVSEVNGWAHIYHYDYSGKLIKQVTEGEWEVIGIDAIDPDKELLYYVSTEESPLERHLYMIGFNGKKKKKLTGEPGNHRLNVSPNGKYYLDVYSNTETPTQVEMWDTRGKMIDKIADNKSVNGFMDNHFYSPRELFSFTTSDGQKLDGYMVKPMDFDEGKAYPMVLSIYGGPGSQGVYNSFETNGFHQYLAQNGYLIVNVNNRGNGGYGAKFEKIVHEQLGTWESHDFVETAKYFALKPWVDGDNMAIQGHSYGGYMSSYTMLAHPGVFDVAIVAAPVTDQRLYDCILTESYMGLLDKNEEGYEKSSVLTYAKNLEGHMLLVHSLMDENVHPQNTFQLVRALTDAGKDFDLKIYPPGTHGVAYDLTSYILLQTQYFNYLEEHLK